MWTAAEHERFLQALDLYPRGPWKLVSAYIGTRTTRQAMTHAQKYRQKLERRKRGLKTSPSTQPLDWDPIPIRFQSLETTVDSVEIGAMSRLLDELQVEPMRLGAVADNLQPPTSETSWIDDCLDFLVDHL